MFANPGMPGSLLGALESVLGPLGMVLSRSWKLCPLLRDLGSLLEDLRSLLGDLDSVLGRSWSSWLAPG